jgi:acyl-CoA thioester hydrolase
VQVNYKSPARYDEELTLLTRITRQTAVRIDHAYELRRQDVLVAEGSTTIASVNRQGQVIPIPDRLGKPS